jgi:hexosaminidase
MKKTLKIIGWIILVLLTAIFITWFGFLKPKPPPVSDADRSSVTLMPLPAELKLRKGEFILDQSLAYDFSSLTSPKLERAVDRFYKKLSRESGMELGTGNNKVLILDCSGTAIPYPSHGDDESYTIKVSKTKIVVKAPEETGIIYALETLLQLASEDDGKWVIPALPGGPAQVSLAGTDDRCLQTLDTQGGDNAEPGCHGDPEDERITLASQ